MQLAIAGHMSLSSKDYTKRLMAARCSRRSLCSLLSLVSVALVITLDAIELSQGARVLVPLLYNLVAALSARAATECLCLAPLFFVPVSLFVLFCSLSLCQYPSAVQLSAQCPRGVAARECTVGL